MSLVTLKPQNSGAIDGEKNNQRENFYRFANETRETIAQRMMIQGRGGVTGAQWWERLPDALRVYLLSTIALDDWQRYEGVAWGALPEGLRSAIATECRAIERVIGGCPWR